MHQPGIDTHDEFGPRYKRRHVIERKARRDDCRVVCRRNPLAACALLTAAPRQNTRVTCSFETADHFSPVFLLPKFCRARGAMEYEAVASGSDLRWRHARRDPIVDLRRNGIADGLRCHKTVAKDLVRLRR